MRSACWCLYGRTIRNPALPFRVRSILYVCKGNIVRSPFAEHYSKWLIRQKRGTESPLEIASGGLATPDTRSSPKEAVESAARFGVALREHESRLIDSSMFESNDMVVVMDVWQLKMLNRMFPEHSEKIFLLPLFDRERDKHEDGFWRYNIVDPYGKKSEDYADCYKRMSTVLVDFLDAVNPPRVPNAGK
ncbi:MAG: hypothetical protein IH611_12825 [Deltaproteobacteria bacterium]|nr:hypothetical protein [Deltaproteobacteria bacterium]